MSIEGINSTMSYQSMQPKPTPTVSAAAVKVASVSDTVKKTTIRDEADSERVTQSETVKKPVTQDDLKKVVERLNSEMDATECRYRLHEGTNRVMISIVDRESQEVIKEFPVEEALDRISKAWELAGLLVDEKL